MRVISETTPRARVAHTCFACRGTIAPGSTYTRTALVYDGYAYATKEHTECVEALRFLGWSSEPDGYSEGILDEHQDDAIEELHAVLETRPNSERALASLRWLASLSHLREVR